MSVSMEKIISLCKRRGFVYPGSDIYGGLSGTYDYGHYGLALKKNITALWWKMFVEERGDMYGVDAAILMHPKAWEASGHVKGFSDPMVECAKCKRRFRADHVEDTCPEDGGILGEVRQFNMMFATHIGAAEDESSITYLRPETAGGIFLNFKNVIDSFHPQVPFGIAQIGKAFRNEISPRDFLFRTREFEQMEIEYFVRENEWEEHFENWRKSTLAYFSALGIATVSEYKVPHTDLAHYSKRTIDFEFDFPFGRKEISGLAYRADFDLIAHTKGAGVDLSVLNEETKTRVIPHVIEPSFGVDRVILALLASAYTEDEMGEGGRSYLAFKPNIAPVSVAVFPLLRNKPELVAKAQEVYLVLKKEIPRIEWDDNGNIGKRYRRQDEIGTPFCITVDFQTMDDETVTIRDRDTGKQERVALADIVALLADRLRG